MIKLTLTEKGGEPKVLTFDKDEITIGRVSGNDIVLAKGNISKRHTRLTKRDNGMEIADLKSTNGTYVNGRKIAGPTAVAPSDRIYVGDFLIGIDGPAARWPSRADCTAPPVLARRPASAARRLPVPPPPPPPARGGSSAARLPDEDETPRAARTRKRPGLRPGRRAPDARSAPAAASAPPARRQPTPLASRSLGLGRRRAVAAARPRRATRPRTTPATSACSNTRAAATTTATPARGAVPTGNRPGLGGGGGASAPAFGGATGPGDDHGRRTRPAVPPPVWRRCWRIPR